MKKVNLTPAKSLRLIVGMVVFCVLLGMLTANSMKILSIASFGNKKTVISANGNGSQNGGSQNGGSQNGGSNGGSSNNGSNGGSNNSGAGTTSGALPSTEAPTTANNGNGGNSGNGDSGNDTPAPTPTPTPTPDTTKPTTTEPTTDSPAVKKEKALILGEYKTVVNASNTFKTGFTKTRYRQVEKDGFFSIVLKSQFERKFPDYFIPQNSPEEITVAKGGDMTSFCIPYENTACTADTAKASEMLKSATKAKNEDGNIVITLVLRDEVNPVVRDEDGKPASYTSSVLDILTSEEFGEMASKAKIFGHTDITLTYSECTIELVYSPISVLEQSKIISLKQTINYTAKVSDQAQDFWNGFAGDKLPVSTGISVTDVSEYHTFVTALDQLKDDITGK